MTYPYTAIGARQKRPEPRGSGRSSLRVGNAVLLLYEAAVNLFLGQGFLVEPIVVDDPVHRAESLQQLIGQEQGVQRRLRHGVVIFKGEDASDMARISSTVPTWVAFPRAVAML